jgi:hypothetical protein
MNVERIIGPTLHDIGFLESQEIQPETKRLFNQFLKFFKRDSFYRQAIVNHHWNSVNGLTFPRTEVIYTNKTHHVKAHLSNTPKNKFIELAPVSLIPHSRIILARFGLPKMVESNWYGKSTTTSVCLAPN